MELAKYLMIWSLLLLVSGCATPTVKEREYIQQVIEQKERPRGVEMHDVEWYVVTPENIEEFLEEFKGNTGDVVFFAISVPHYENLALNLAELRRYIEQQQSIILYYENSINKPDSNKTNSEE
jgi:hypothetical protein